MYITCITRMLFNSHKLRGTTCHGASSLFDTHCCYCQYWIENQADEANARALANFERSEKDEEMIGEEENDQL